MTYKVYNVTQHYLVEINQYRSAIESNDVEKLWIWDIHIASDGGEVYKGRALESSGEYEVPWTELSELKPLEEMIRHCRAATFNI